MTGAEPFLPVDERLRNPIASLGDRGDGIGFVGTDVPIDVLLATGRPFGHLPWESSGRTPWADRWLESSFPYWARSILEQWHQGAFDGIETVVFSRADDASQRLYYYITELRRRGLLPGPAPRIFDIALIRRESSVARTAASILELGQGLGVGPGRLEDGIERANQLRQTLADIERQRMSDGPRYEHLSRAALWSDPTQWIGDVVLPEPVAGNGRVLLAGSFPPDDRIHESVEAAGASVVAEAHVHGLGRLGPAVPTGSEPPEQALAQHLTQTSTGPRAMLDRARWIVQQAKDVRAGAVILWLTREEEALAWHVPAQRRALATAGINTLILTAARWQADDDSLDRVARFCSESSDATA